MSGKKLDKYRAEALVNEQGETYNGHSHAYWAFCKVTLAQTLLHMNELDELQALEVFNLILTYAGLIIPTKGGKHLLKVGFETLTCIVNSNNNKYYYIFQRRILTNWSKKKTTCY